MSTSILETVRLRLRELTEDDLDFVASMLSHPDVSRFYERSFDRGAAQLWLDRQLARYRRDGHGLWLAVNRLTDRPVGQVGLMLQDVEGQSVPELGWLLDRAFWGLGYATEAATAVRDAAFPRWGYSDLISLIRPENLASQAVAGRLGMRPGRHVLFHGFTTIVFGCPAPGAPVA